ncbi:MAG TPA: hypothetical protein VF834_11135, partial [Streptosporangiaceae bacterium]
MSEPDAVPLPREGEVFFDVRGDARTMRLSWYADSAVAVFSIWQGNRCTGTFRLPFGDLARMVQVLQSGPRPSGADQDVSSRSGAAYDVGGRVPDAGYGQSGGEFEPGYETAGYETAGYRAPGYRAPGYDGPGYDGPGYGGPGYGGPGHPAAVPDGGMPSYDGRLAHDEQRAYGGAASYDTAPGPGRGTSYGSASNYGSAPDYDSFAGYDADSASGYGRSAGPDPTSEYDSSRPAYSGPGYNGQGYERHYPAYEPPDYPGVPRHHDADRERASA